MRNISVDFANKTIILSRRFSEAATIPFSDEYRELTNITKEHPDMNVIVRTSGRSHTNENKGLTYRYMRSFIRNLDANNLMAFEETIAHYEKYYDSDATVYKNVKDWFLENYPRHKEMIVESEPQIASDCKVA